MRYSGKQTGYSMIELMVVVAIIGILGAVAYPSYTQYVTRTNRTDAMETLTEVMNQQQRFIMRNRRYATDLRQLGFGQATLETSRGLYVIAAAACGSEPIQRCVQLTATPQGVQQNDGVITLNSRGEKQWAGQAGWYHRK